METNRAFSPHRNRIENNRIGDSGAEKGVGIDIQGDVQSFRGGSANGLILNDTGNLNLVKLHSLTNSTIVGQPVSHLQIQNRSHVIVVTPSRTITGAFGATKNDGRNGVKVDTSLNPIGPLSLPHD